MKWLKGMEWAWGRAGGAPVPRRLGKTPLKKRLGTRDLMEWREDPVGHMEARFFLA